MKLKELLSAKPVIAKHLNDSIPARLAYKFFKLAKKIDENEEFYRAKITALLNECAEKDANGKYVENAAGFKLKPDKLEEWKNGKDETENIEVEVAESFSISELAPLNLSVQDIINIQNLIQEDDNG